MERLEIPYPVALDPDLEVWRLYGNRGWPGRYLFDRRGLLRFLHYGEGEYLETELAIQECLLEIDADLELPAPLEPLRPEDAPGVLLEPQTADIVLPADRDRLELVRDWTDGEDWIEAADAGAAASFSVQRRRRLRGAVGRRRGAGALRDGRHGDGGVARAAAARLAVHARAASAFRISFGSMKRTSSWTTSNSETSSVPRSRKKSTSR